MRIVRLTADSFKRLKAVDITPEGEIVQITGKNAQGKSSVLDAIEVALAGARHAPDKPIHQGQQKARIVCELDDIVVTRTFSKKGTALKVESKEGDTGERSTFSSPQAMLDKLVGELSFDPLAFTRMNRLDQLALLRELTGVDTSKLDTAIDDLKVRRLERGRSLKAMRATPMPEHHADAPKEFVSVEELMAKLRQARTLVVQIHERVTFADKLRERRLAIQSEIELLQNEDEEVAEKLSLMESQIQAAGDPPDTEAIEAAIAGAEAENQKIRENVARSELVGQIHEEENAIAKLNRALTEAEASREAILEHVDFPVKELGFDEDGVTFNGLPFDQASQAEQLRVSVAMGLALNPKLPVILIRDGSLLDAENLRVVGELAAEAGAQVWIERVSDGEKVGVYIEDGTSFQ